MTSAGAIDSPLLECRAISKSFGGSQALRQVDFDLVPGEVHGLVGSNGAGKSTLMKVLAGVVTDFDGELRLGGQPVRFTGPMDALRQGIAMVYQELSGIGQLSVAENLFLGRQPGTAWGSIHWSQMRMEARKALQALGLDLDVTRRLDSFPLVIRQMVEIARGIHRGAKILVLDEPTSALSPPEAKRLFELIRQLRQQGVAMVFISHFIDDVLAICDRVSVLKDGRLLETQPASALNKPAVIAKMLGTSTRSDTAVESTVLPPAVPKASQPVLETRGLTRTGEFAGIDLALQPGEWLSIYGFQGAGHLELLQALAGATTPQAGSIRLSGQTLPLGKVHRAKQAGMVFVGADRGQTLVHRAPIFQNVTMAYLPRVANWLTQRKELQVTQPLLDQVSCNPRNGRLLAGSLSGGNQQKVVLAKWLMAPAKVLLLEEPTRGMDVGAKADVLELVRRMQAQGTAVILATTEPELALYNANRVLVMSRGKLSHEFTQGKVDVAELTRHA